MSLDIKEKSDQIKRCALLHQQRDETTRDAAICHPNSFAPAYEVSLPPKANLLLDVIPKEQTACGPAYGLTLCWRAAYAFWRIPHFTSPAVCGGEKNIHLTAKAHMMTLSRGLAYRAHYHYMCHNTDILSPRHATITVPSVWENSAEGVKRCFSSSTYSTITIHHQSCPCATNLSRLGKANRDIPFPIGFWLCD